MPRGACHHEIWGVLIEAKGHTSRPYYGKANAPACRCGGEHAVLWIERKTKLPLLLVEKIPYSLYNENLPYYLFFDEYWL
ncbi:hypothetical protein CUMW_257970 [Citrus unshiu]|uniref:Uncharacterized protein n=1 Tax=Citrus unshiu TaxID=55188 RepID=A0A2H5QTK4_CITUN|nr:hypothetical protein CUMW_257970 [Citrus unshiu]